MKLPARFWFAFDALTVMSCCSLHAQSGPSRVEGTWWRRTEFSATAPNRPQSPSQGRTSELIFRSGGILQFRQSDSKDYDTNWNRAKRDDRIEDPDELRPFKYFKDTPRAKQDWLLGGGGRNETNSILDGYWKQSDNEVQLTLNTQDGSVVTGKVRIIDGKLTPTKSLESGNVRILLSAADRRQNDEFNVYYDQSDYSFVKSFGAAQTPKNLPGELTIDRIDSPENPLTDKNYRSQVEAELAEASKQQSKEERRKEDDFERIHKQKLEEWRTNLRNHKASYDDHPDVLMMKNLTGQEGTLIAPSVTREYDNMLIDRGWYPLAQSMSQRYTDLIEGKKRAWATDRERFESDLYGKRDNVEFFDPTVKNYHPDVPPQIKLPAYNEVRDYFLKAKEGAK